MTDESKNPKDKKDENIDPLNDLNIIEEKVTIETEKDALDLLEVDGVESIPEYDSESGSIIKSDSTKNSEKIENEVESEKDKESEENVLINKINQLDVSNNKNKEEKVETTISDITTKKAVKTTKKLNKSNPDENADKAETKIIDNVKVDENGVPLLNQFDTEPIKENISKKIRLSKRNITQIIIVAIGIIITVIGILEALEDVLRISDHVVYGEHEAMAIGLIFFGILIILLAFYKELLNLLGVSNFTESMEQMDGKNSSSSMPKPHSKTNNKENNNNHH